MMPPNFTTLKIDAPTEFILRLSLNRPAVRNAINYQMMQELRDFWQYINTNSEKFRCIILTGSGDKAFCAGADLKERNNLDLSVWQQQHIALEQAMLAMIDCPIPIIAAVNGAAFGGGLELALASDFAYAATTATFAQSETKLGLIPAAMGTQNLPKRCGIARAKELCFTAATFTAEQAYAWGIVNKLCAPAELMPTVLATANKIAANAPFAIQQAKKALTIATHSAIKIGFAFEIKMYNELLPTQDRVEGITAFNEKRVPRFNGK